jgi:uncharacterized protein
MGPGTKPRVFLDSNVIFSGLYSPEGGPGRILEHFIKGDITVIVSQQVLEEVVRTIKEKLPGALPALRRLLLNTPPEVVADPAMSDIAPWRGRLQPGDAAVLVAAAAARPDYFVTGDRHFLSRPDIAESAGIRIVTPVQLLKEWRKPGSGD